MNLINRFALLRVAALVLLLGKFDTLLAQQTFMVSSSSLTFSAQAGAAPPAAQSFALTSSAGTASFTIGYTYAQTGVAWIFSVSPLFGNTPATVLVSVNQAGLSPGTYTATMTISNPTHALLTIPVTLTVTSGAGPNLAATPSSLTFSAQVGGSAPASQNLQIGSSGSQLSYTAAVTTASGGNWLQINPTGGSTPGTIAASINQAVLNGLAVGTYNGTVTLTAQGASNSPLAVQVTLTVNPNPNLTATPPGGLTFNYQLGTSSNPPAQTVNVGSSGTPLSFQVGISTNSGGNWLVVSPLAGTSPQDLSVNVLPATLGLPAGTYTGAVFVFSQAAANSPLVVPITLNVSTNPLLSATPSALTFTYQVGTPNPSNKTVTLTSTGGSIPYTAAASTQTGGNWLTVGPATGSSPGTLNVGVSPGGLAPGTYQGAITLTAPTAGNSPVTVAVTLTVSNNPLITLSPGALSFAFQTGQAAPASQTVTVGSTGTPLTFSTAASTASGGSWLSVSPSTGNTSGSGTLTVTVSPTGLAPGTYTGTITVTAAGAGNTPATLAVTFVVSNTPLLVVSPGALSFSAAVGSTTLQAQPAALTTTDSSLQNFTISTTTNTGGSWLLVGPLAGATPNNLNVAVNPTGLSVGVFTGSVVIASTGLANSPQMIAVTLVITPSATLAAAPATLAFAQATGGSNPPNQTLSITSTTGTLNLQASASTASGGNWLTVTPATATTPGSFTVSATGANLSAGTYTGSITITSTAAANSPLTVPVTLTVSVAQGIQASPATFSFTHQLGATNPSPQTLQVSLSGGGTGSFSAAATTAQGTWLSVSPSSGGLPGSTNVIVNPAGLAPGTYSGQIAIAVSGANNSPLNVPVTLTVSGASLSVTPGTLPFSYALGTAAPAPQTITVSSSAPVSFSVSASSGLGLNWLSAVASGPVTPATVTVRVDPAGLVAGSYTGAVNITAPGTSGSPQTVTVTLVVITPPISPMIAAVVNGASLLEVDLAAGLVATIYGTSIGPTTPASLRLNAQGRVDTMIGDTRVLFDGIPAPMIYAASRIVSCVVPYALANRAFTSLQVEYLGVRSPAVTVRVSQTSPGIFTLNSTGSGPGAILNQDNSINGPNNPEAKGSYIVIYATGEGQTIPPGIDGAVIGANPPQPIQRVTVTIGGQAAEVLYAGSAPSFVAGVLQINARIPESVGSGPQQVVVNAGNASSQPGVTVSVR